MRLHLKPLDQTAGGVDDLGPRCHQGISGSQHYQIRPHFPPAVLDRVQRLGVHASQAGQLIRIDPIILALTSLRSVHQPRVGHQHFVPATADDFLHPSRVCPHLHHHTRPIQPLEKGCKILLRRPQLSLGQGFPPPDPTHSSGSIGRPDPLPPSDGRDWGQALLADPLLHSLLPPLSDPALLSAFPPVPPALLSYPAAPGPATSSVSMSVHSSFQNCYAPHQLVLLKPLELR